MTLLFAIGQDHERSLFPHLMIGYGCLLNGGPIRPPGSRYPHIDNTLVDAVIMIAACIEAETDVGRSVHTAAATV